MAETREAGPGQRRQGRVAAMRLMYRAEVVGDDLAELRAEFAQDSRLPDEAQAHALHLLDLVLAHAAEIDDALRGALERWELKRLAVIDRCVLRLGAAELMFDHYVPTGVALDEAIEIAKRFGSINESGRFVNGVLDAIARQHRRKDAP